MKKAFTLVELLVAMAIIGVILGLALFGIAAAQRNARDTVRRSTLKDISAGIADLYSKSGKTATSIFVIQSTALVRAQGDNSESIALCDASINCVSVPLDVPAVPHPAWVGPLQANPVVGNGTTTSGTTRYYFNSQTDGYHLGVCLENGSLYDVSTSANPIPNFCG